MAKKETDKAPPRIGRLDSLGGVVKEMAKIYREARRGDLDIGQATRLTYILREMRAALEASDLEMRVRELEDRKQ